MRRFEIQDEQYSNRLHEYQVRYGRAYNRLLFRLDDGDCNYAYFDELQQRCEAL